MARFHYDPLNRSANEIRLVTLWPGLFDDPVKIDITHCPLKASTPPRPPDYLSLEDLRTTLPQDGSWTVHETLEGHMIFADQLTEADAWTSWAHPDPSVEYSPCDPEAPDQIHRAEPDFEALSYTWGSAIATTTAVVTSVVENLTGGAVQEQTPSRGELSIGHNLEEAIRHLRYSDRPRVMWIDAICIDQESIQDRNEQVPRMGEIYSLARRVVAWIGPGFDGSKSAMTSLDYLGSQVEFTKDRLRVPRPGCAEPTWYDRAVALPYDENTWEAIATVFSRPWFSRLWILQEIQLGSASSVIRCGNDKVRWSTLCRALFTLYHKDEGVPAKLHEAMYEPRVICDYSAAVKFDHLLWTYDTRACSDQRDKIYGLMNLAPSEIACRISVDYSQSVAEVYKQAFSVYLEYYRRLDFLVQAGLDQRTAASSAPSQWPTWLPNWSRKSVNTLSPDAGFCASGFSASGTKLNVSTNELEAAGVFLSAVSSVDCLDSMDFVQLVQYLRGLGIKKLSGSTYYTGESLLDAYLLTLSCCEVEDRYPAAGSPTMACLRDRVMELATGKEVADHALPSSYEERFALQLRDSYLFLTSDGHVGTCRTKAEVLSGDRVFIPLGCEAPILLRPSHDGTYQIVGDCYVHGVMHGEVLLGPIEDPWIALIYRRTDGVFRTYFQIGDKAEDAAVLDDPRLQQIPLPPDWEFIGWGMTAGDAKYCPKYRHKETGEEINYDPRMTLEALISRGVTVETVTIV